MNESIRNTGEAIRVDSVKRRGNGFQLLFSNGNKTYLSIDSLSRFRLTVGEILDDHLFYEIIAQSEEDTSFQMALDKINVESSSTYAVQKHLLDKGHDPEIVEKVILRLTEVGLLDDESYAFAYADDLAELRLLGKNQIIYQLQQNGIGDDIINSIPFPREKELSKAIRYGESIDKRNSSVPYRKRKAKVHLALIRKGFEEDVADEATERVVKEDDEVKMGAELERQFNLAKTKYSRQYEGHDLRNHIISYLLRRGFDYDDIQTILGKEDL